MAYTFSLGQAGQGHRYAATVSRLNPLVPLAKSPPRGYIGYGEAATRVRNQHIPGALSILKGTVSGQVRGPGHMVPTYFRRELRDRAFQRRLRLRSFLSLPHVSPPVLRDHLFPVGCRSAAFLQRSTTRVM